MEIIKMEDERQKLENDQKIQTATKDLTSTIAELEARQAELIEKLKVRMYAFDRFSLLFLVYLLLQIYTNRDFYQF